MFILSYCSLINSKAGFFLLVINIGLKILI